MTTKNPSVAFRPTPVALARIDFEAKRLGQSRYTVVSDLVQEALDTRGVRQPTADEIGEIPPPQKRGPKPKTVPYDPNNLEKFIDRLPRKRHKPKPNVLEVRIAPQTEHQSAFRNAIKNLPDGPITPKPGSRLKPNKKARA